MSREEQENTIVEIEEDERNTLPVLPLVSPEEAARQWATYQELKRRLLVEEDFSTIKGKRHANKSAFRKLAVFFGLTDRIVEQERTERADDSFMWRLVVEAQAPNGRKTVGVGICDSREREFAHVEHDVYATAHTRAKNRAFSDMFAGGIVSAEELEAEPPRARAQEPLPKHTPEQVKREGTAEKKRAKVTFGHWPEKGDVENTEQESW